MRARTALVLGAALILGASLFGTPALLPAGIALVALPVLAGAWVLLAAAGLRVRREVPAAPLIEGNDYPLGLEVRSRLLPPPAGEVRDPLLDKPHGLDSSHRVQRWNPTVCFQRRGRVDLGSAEVVIADPFGLTRRQRRGADAGRAVVLPRTEPIHFSPGGEGRSALGMGERGGGGAGPDSWAAEFEIDGLRRYRKGTPAARIHWPTVARTGELHERRITSGADAARLVVLDPSRAAGEAALDDAVRAAASICLELGADRGCTLLVGGEPRPIEVEAGLGNFGTAHGALALVEATGGAPATQRIGRAGIVIWVTADPSGAPQRALRRLPASRRILVRPAGCVGGPESGVLFTVSGCTALELGARTRRPRARAAS